MSGDNSSTQGGSSTVTPQTDSQTVPLVRLNEEIQRRKEIDAENQVLKQILTRAVPQAQPQQRPPEQLSPRLRKLKEEDPAAFQFEYAREQEIKQLRAHAFMTQDQLDRVQFHQAYGKKAEQYSAKVEATLEQLRSQGMHQFNRGHILKNLIADETLARELSPTYNTGSTVPAPVSPAPVAPSSDPKLASPTPPAASGASGSGANKKFNIEEFEALHADDAF